MRSPAALRIIALLTLALAGCSAPATAPVANTDTIVWFANSLTQSPNEPRLALIDAFERAYPSITVELRDAPTSTDANYAALVEQLTGGASTPDVYLGHVVWPYELGSRGLALPLSDQFPASFWKRFPSALVQAATYSGATYAVPLYVNEGLLYYRKDLLKRAGLTPPTTWEQLASDANVLRGRGLPYQFAWQGNAYEGLTCFWTEMLADAYGGLPGGGTAATAAELASPQALRALTFLRGLIGSGVSPIDTDSFEETDTSDAFASGQAAFMRGWNTAYNAVVGYNSRLTATQVGVVAPPTFQGESGPGWSTIGGWDLYINPYSRHLAADRTFIDWLTGPQAQRILATEYDEIPSDAALRDDPAVIAVDPSLATAPYTRLVSRPSANVDYGAVSHSVYTAVHSALPGQSKTVADPCRALLSAAHQVDPAVRGTLRCGSPAGASTTTPGGG